MGNITQEIDNIKNAVYGKDVRQSIVKALETCYEDGSKSGNANMEVAQARGTYSNLNERLSRENSDLNSRIRNLASGSPLVAGSIEEMEDTTKVYVNTADGHWYYYDGTNWINGGNYQSTVLDNETKDANKLSFSTYKKRAVVTLNYLNKGQGIRTDTGAVYNNNTLARTGRIVTSNRVLAVLNSNDYEMSTRYFSNNTDSFEESYIINEPMGNLFYIEKYPFVAFVFRRKDKAELTNEDITNILSCLEFYKLCDDTLTEENVPADAKIVGKKIEFSNDNINYLFKNIFTIENDFATRVGITLNQTIADDGDFETDETKARTGRNSTSNTKFIYLPSTDYQFMPKFYSSNSEPAEECFLGGLDWTNSAYVGDYRYFALVFRKIDNTQFTQEDIDNLHSLLKFLKKPVVEEDVKESINKNNVNASFSMYAKWGVCGASWSKGYFYLDGDNTPKVRPDLSWGANVARRNGNTYYDFCKQSITTRSYLTDSNCLQKVLETEPCDLYIISLGGNDRSYLGENYLGTIDDIKEDYTQNADSFYGNYARIIENIKSHAPDAKIICSISHSSDATELQTRFHQAVLDVAERYGLPTINPREDDYFNTNSDEGLIHSHPTAVQLSGMASAWERLYSKCVDKYYDYFKNYNGSVFE